MDGATARLPPTAVQSLASNVYSGRSRVFKTFGQRIVTGPPKDTYTFIAAFVLIIAPSGVFFGYVAPLLWTHGYAFAPVLFAYFLIQTIVELFRTTTMDPGIIPRDLDLSPPLMGISMGSGTTPAAAPYRGAHAAQPAPVAGETAVQITDDTLPASYPFVPPTAGTTTTTAAFRDVLISGTHHAHRRWCETCRTYRPLRTSHCSICDNCIDAHDHHCPWTSNCVGRRNYRHFFFFVGGCALLSIWIIAFSIVYLTIASAESGGDFPALISKNPAPLILVVYGFFLGLSLSGLFFMHLQQIAHGYTTHESVGGFSIHGMAVKGS